MWKDLESDKVVEVMYASLGYNTFGDFNVIYSNSNQYGNVLYSPSF